MVFQKENLFNWMTIVKWALLLIFLFVAQFVFFPEDRSLYEIPKRFVLSLVFILGLAIVLIEYLKSDLSLNLNIIDLWMIFYTLFVTLNIFFHFSNFPVFPDWWLWICGYFLIRTEFDKIQNNDGKCTLGISMFTLLMVICLCHCFLGLLQFFDFFKYPGEIVYDSKIISTFSNPNGLGIFLAGCFPFLICLFFTTRLLPKKLMVIVVSFLLLIILYLTNSRASWIAIVLGILFYLHQFIKDFFSLKVKVLLSVFLVILFFLGVNFLINLNIESVLGRLKIFEISLEIIKDHWFVGIGENRFNPVFVDYQRQFFKDNPDQTILLNLNHPNNQLLLIFLEQGIIGFITYISIFFIVLTSAFTTLRSKKLDTSKKHLIVSLISAIIIIGIHGCMDTNLNYQSIGILWVFILGVYASLFPVNIKSYILIPKTPTSKKRIISGLFGILFLVILTESFVYKSIGMYNWYISENFFKEKEWLLCSKHNKKAVRYIKDEAFLYFKTGISSLFIGDFNHSIDMFDKCQEFYITSDLYYYKSLAYEKNEDIDMAIRSLNSEIKAYPILLKPRKKMAELLIAQNKYDSARIVLKHLLNIKPKIISYETKYIQNSSALMYDRLNNLHTATGVLKMKPKFFTPQKYSK